MGTHKKCTNCGKPTKVRPYAVIDKCSRCVKWAIIHSDIERVSASGSVDYAEWEAAR